MKQFADCCLCSQIAGDPSNDLLSNLLGDTTYKRRIPFESKNFAAIPSLGPLCKGHTLLCTRHHVKSIAAISSELDSEVYAFKAELINALAKAFQEPVHCFEHGMAGVGGRILCTVDHAHLHLVPSRVSVLIPLFSSGLEVREIEPGLAALRQATGSGEYLYYQTPDNKHFLLRAPTFEIPSQFLRRIFAASLGRPDEWNWRDYPNPQMADDCFADLQTPY